MVPGFDLEGELGRGGMGVVYRARQRATGRQVALKVIAGHLAGGETHRERFRREGEVMAALRHPGIVAVHAAGFDGDVAWLACELVDGAKTLDAAARGASLRRKVELARDVAAALGHAHAQGVVHRDALLDLLARATLAAPAADAPAALDRLWAQAARRPRSSAWPELLRAAGELALRADPSAPVAPRLRARLAGSGAGLDEVVRALVRLAHEQLDPAPSTCERLLLEALQVAGEKGAERSLTDLGPLPTPHVILAAARARQRNLAGALEALALAEEDPGRSTYAFVMLALEVDQLAEGPARALARVERALREGQDVTEWEKLWPVRRRLAGAGQ